MSDEDAVGDGPPGAAQDFPGEVVMSRYDDPATGVPRLRIDRADPRVLFTAELLDRSDTAPALTRDGDLVRIVADNRTVIYRLVGYDAPTHCYKAEWPD